MSWLLVVVIAVAVIVALVIVGALVGDSHELPRRIRESRQEERPEVELWKYEYFLQKFLKMSSCEEQDELQLREAIYKKLMFWTEKCDLTKEGGELPQSLKSVGALEKERVVITNSGGK